MTTITKKNKTHLLVLMVGIHNEFQKEFWTPLGLEGYFLWC